MSLDLFRRLAMFVGLWGAQVLVLNHIHLFGMAIPLLYVYFTISFHRNTPRWVILLWSFALGLAIDVFSNTPGLAAGSMTLIGLLQPYLLELFVVKDSFEELEVSMRTLGASKYATFVGILLTVYCLVFFGLEAFTLFNWVRWLLSALGSAVLTLVLILAIESTQGK